MQQISNPIIIASHVYQKIEYKGSKSIDYRKHTAVDPSKADVRI